MFKKFVSVFCAAALLACTPMTALAGSWQSDNTGWWYQEDDGSYPAAAWKQVDGVWYHFSENGYMDTGWILDGGVWYYLEASGAMRTADLTENGRIYHFDGTGACTNPQGEDAASDTRSELTGDLEYALALLQWSESVDAAVSSMDQWDVYLDEGRYDELKVAAQNARAPFEEFERITPPAKYASAHGEFIQACNDFLLFLDLTVQLADGLKAGSLSDQQLLSIASEMEQHITSMEDHCSRGIELFDAVNAM